MISTTKIKHKTHRKYTNLFDPEVLTGVSLLILFTPEIFALVIVLPCLSALNNILTPQVEIT
jgi:hypothetical protein